MSRLEELIQQYCPNGVEYKKLGTIAEISRGGNFQKKDYVHIGVPCIHYGQLYTRFHLFVTQPISYISEKIAARQKYAEQNDIIMAVTSENIEDVCTCVSWLGDGRLAISGHTAIIHHSENAKYLTYFFNSTLFGAVPDFMI